MELREDTGRDVSQGARDLHKDLRAFISSARRDAGKLAKALQRDFDQAQKQLAQGTGTAGEARAKATTEPASRPKAAKPKRVTAPGGSNARAARSPQEKTATAKPRTRTAATPTARAGSATPTARAGGRREQLLALVVDQPGITLAQAAKQFGLKDASGLYAVARRLQDDGLVRKSGAELHPTA